MESANSVIYILEVSHSSVHPVYSTILLVVIIILNIAHVVVAFCC